MSLPESKDEAVAQLHKQIDEASRKIDELKLKANLAEAEAKSAFEERIADLEVQKVKLREKTNDLKEDASGAWQDLARGCHESWKEFSESVHKAIDEFRS